MGDIPDRGLFRHPVLEKALTPYFDIVKGPCFLS
jgi:26S proteasome regulatory subunit N3